MPFMDELPSLRADPHRKMELKAKKTNTEVCCLSDAEPPHLSSVASTPVLFHLHMCAALFSSELTCSKDQRALGAPSILVRLDPAASFRDPAQGAKHTELWMTCWN